jgi:hypothetical protein
MHKTYICKFTILIEIRVKRYSMKWGFLKKKKRTQSGLALCSFIFCAESHKQGRNKKK